MFTKDLHYSPTIEKAILGACMIERDAIGRVYGFLQPEHFYYDSDKYVFEIMGEMFANGIPIDCYTVTDYIRRVKNQEVINGGNTSVFVYDLTNHVVGTAHLEYHAYVVRMMWIDREIITITSSGTPDGTAKDKLVTLQQRLYEIQQFASASDWADMSELMVKLYQHQDKMRETKGMGIPIGIHDIDQQNGGFHPGQSIIIAARPSVGKSAFAGGLAINMARNGNKVGIISLEMANEEIAARIAAYDTDTDFSVLYRGLYGDEQQMRYVYDRIASKTSQLPIYVSDKTNVTVADIRAKAQKLKHTHGLDCLMIDYLQLIDIPESKNRTRENEVSKISRQCKIMAKEMGIPVVLLCQLNRELTKRTGKDRYPRLSDLRESGSLEQDADAVMFLHRDWMIDVRENENGHSTEKEADIVIRKWRNGANNFTIPLDFDPPKMMFTRRRYAGPVPQLPVSDENEPF